LGWENLDGNGLVETMQEIILLFTICYLLLFLNKLKNKKCNTIKIFLILETLGLSYFFFEEISWGQHIIGYNTPDFLFSINNQKEFNLHNISNLFNELPKSFVFIWCGIAIPFVKLFKPKIKNIYYIIINPNNKLIKISIILLVFTIPNLIASKLNLIEYNLLHLEGGIDYGLLHKDDIFYIGYKLKMFLIVVFSFNFFRISELHEFIFAYYFLWHSIYLRKYILNK
tara:strand:+ start:31 stop:711 length:681 start_codon:yes stop_codon:yes gene_type:complete